MKKPKQRSGAQPSNKKRKVAEGNADNLSEKVKLHIMSLDATSDIYTIKGWNKCTVKDCPSYAEWKNSETERNISCWIHRPDHAECRCDYNPNCLVSLGVFPPNGAVPNTDDGEQIRRDYMDCLFRKYVMVEREKISKHVKKMLQPTGTDDLTALLHRIIDYNRSLLSSNVITEQEQDDTKVFICIPPGMKNFGATCYVNSQLQCLALIPPLIDRLLSLTDDELTKSKNGNIVSCLQELFVDLKFGWSCKVSPHRVVDSIGLDHDEQQDAHEFATLLLQDKLDALSDVINEIFCGQEEYLTKCLTCSNSSPSPSDFWELFIKFGHGNKKGKTKAAGIQTYIVDYFSAKEYLNDYFCNICNKKVDAVREVKLKSAPKVLTIQLGRYSYEQATPRKNQQKVLMPRTLALTDAGNALEEYTLCAVVSCKHFMLKIVVSKLFFELICVLFLFHINSCHTRGFL